MRPRRPYHPRAPRECHPAPHLLHRCLRCSLGGDMWRGFRDVQRSSILRTNPFSSHGTPPEKTWFRRGFTRRPLWDVEKRGMVFAMTSPTSSQRCRTPTGSSVIITKLPLEAKIMSFFLMVYIYVSMLYNGFYNVYYIIIRIKAIYYVHTTIIMFFLICT